MSKREFLPTKSNVNNGYVNRYNKSSENRTSRKSEKNEKNVVKLTPRPHQVKFLKRFFESKSHGMCAVHPTGSGKTFLFIMVAEQYLKNNPDNRIIFCAPKTLVNNMIKEIHKIGGVNDISKWSFITIDKFINGYKKFTNYTGKIIEDDEDDENDENDENDGDYCKEMDEIKNDFDIGEIEYDEHTEDSLYKNLNKSLLMVDEAHNLKTEITFKKKVLKSGGKAYFFIKASGYVDRVMLATATPLVNYVYDINNLVSMMTHPSLRPKGKTKFGIETSWYDSEYFEDMVFNDREKAIDVIGGKFDFHHLSEEDLAEYPNVVYRNEYIVMNDKVLDWYKAQEKYYGGDTRNILDEDFFKKDLSKFFTGIRLAGNLNDDNSPESELINSKLRKIKEIINQHKNKDGQLNRRFIIYSQYVKWGIDRVRRLMQDEGIETSVIIGSSNEEQRKEEVKRYNEGLVDVLLISKCGREGIDTKKTDFVIIMENGWNVSTEQQVVGRAVRRGSHLNYPRNTVEVIRLLSVKPNDFYNGPEDVIEMKGNFNKEGEFKSADLLLMGISRRKIKILSNVFQMMDMYNQDKDKSSKQFLELSKSFHEKIDRLVFNIHGNEVNVIPKIPSDGVDDLLFAVTESIPYIFEYPIFKFKCRQVHKHIFPPDMKSDMVGESGTSIYNNYFRGFWKNGEYIIYLCINLGNYKQFTVKRMINSLQDKISTSPISSIILNELHNSLRFIFTFATSDNNNFVRISKFINTIRTWSNSSVMIPQLVGALVDNNIFVLSEYTVDIDKYKGVVTATEIFGELFFVKEGTKNIRKVVYNDNNYLLELLDKEPKFGDKTLSLNLSLDRIPKYAVLHI